MELFNLPRQKSFSKRSKDSSQIGSNGFFDWFDFFVFWDPLKWLRSDKKDDQLEQVPLPQMDVYETPQQKSPPESIRNGFYVFFGPR